MPGDGRACGPILRGREKHHRFRFLRLGTFDARCESDCRDAPRNRHTYGPRRATWRPEDFARFEIGRLPDGREEWLEFWLHNHLLPRFAELWLRHERGIYGDREIAFLSLSDLIRSKETEREGDWTDVSLLEEIQDARKLAQAAVKTEPARLFGG